MRLEQVRGHRWVTHSDCFSSSVSFFFFFVVRGCQWEQRRERERVERVRGEWRRRRKRRFGSEVGCWRV